MALSRARVVRPTRESRIRPGDLLLMMQRCSSGVPALVLCVCAWVWMLTQALFHEAKCAGISRGKKEMCNLSATRMKREVRKWKGGEDAVCWEVNVRTRSNRGNCMITKQGRMHNHQ